MAVSITCARVDRVHPLLSLVGRVKNICGGGGGVEGAKMALTYEVHESGDDDDELRVDDASYVDPLDASTDRRTSFTLGRWSK